MGTSHFKSNVLGKTGNEYIATLAAIKNITTISGVTTMTAGTVTGSTSVVGGSVTANNYIQVGTGQYIIPGNANTLATILAEATALVGTPLKGSMYMSKKGNLWFFTSDSTASPVQSLA